MHCRWYPSMPCSRSPGGGAIPACIAGGIPAYLAAGLQRGALLLGVSAPGGCLLLGGVAFCYGLLLCPSVMAFWFGGLLIEGGILIEDSLLVWSWGGQKAIAEGHHTRRPPQKGGVPGGDPHTTHPPGRLLLRAVCILLECILVLWKFALQRCFQKFVYLSYLLQPKNSEGSACDYHSIWRSLNDYPVFFIPSCSHLPFAAVFFWPHWLNTTGKIRSICYCWSGLPWHRENREFGCSFFQTGKT